MTNPFGPGDQNPYGQQPGQPPQQPGPYGQQPPPGPPAYPGQPAYPGGPQPYPQAPMGYYAAPPRRRKKWPWILGGVIGLLAVLAVIGIVFMEDDSATKAKAGDCITAEKSDPKIVDCDKPEAAFKVVEHFKDTGDVTVCQSSGVEGVSLSVEWQGAKGVLCLRVTKFTTVEDFDAFEGNVPVSEAELEKHRDDLVDQGFTEVK